MPPQVSLISSTSYEEQPLRASIETLLEPLGGIESFVKPGSRVLLKPNLLTAGRPGKECITRPEVVSCVAQLIQEAGGKPFLGDSPAFGTAQGVAQANGYLPLTEALNLPIVEFHGQRYETVSDTFNHLRLSKEAMEADVVINLPKVKSHLQLTMTLGVKNLFGCVPGKMKAWWHMEAGKDAHRFGEMLVETARAIQPDLTIADGVLAHQGNGPSGGEPRPLRILGASADVFALDSSLVEVLKVNPAIVPTVAASKRLELCPEQAEVHFPHQSPAALQVSDWKLPDALAPIDFGMPRVARSTFKHLYIRFIKEPLKAYSRKDSSSKLSATSR
ncbi:MAG: thylakoid-associated protein [Cyanobacteria bacterium QS_1_48_34]|nr:MAG: thylakoid-associated protein [Cyanobacteria bacterium QH_10_48_56]PSO74939.1 MAG: thylakoid-associated protein [Cyanobacteria bacterium QS_1_48_34]